MARRDLAGLRVVISGASSGIGWHLAKQLGLAGANLLITARRLDRLEQLATSIINERPAAEVTSFAGDLTKPQIRETLIDVAKTKWGGFDLLINCAGAGAYGPFETASSERLAGIMEVNFFAAAELTRLAIPILRLGRKPMIVNVGSVLGRCAVPFKSEYCASKFALLGWSDALRAELADCGIDVLVVNPSTTESEFFENLLEGNKSAAKGPRRGMLPAVVARKTIRAIRRGRHEIILSWGGKSIVGLNRWFPRLVIWAMARFARKSAHRLENTHPNANN